MKEPLPWTASNGAIVQRRVDRDTYEVSTPTAPHRVYVDVDSPDSKGRPAVELPPNWLHTDEEAAQVIREAQDAYRLYVETVTIRRCGGVTPD